MSEDVIYHDKVPENLHEEFDYFVIGSDQIWNPIGWQTAFF